MEIPHWELGVLCRAVVFPNLTAAASNVGISQPQLSRIVARLEEALSVELLDRASRRKSGWTESALELASIYSGAVKVLGQKLTGAADEARKREIRVGMLEGLADPAIEFCAELLGEGARTEIRQVELDVHDLPELEGLLGRGELDLAFTTRLPTRRKPRYKRLLGYQSLEAISGRSSTLVLSPFERDSRHDSLGRPIRELRPGHAHGPVLVSNSLAIRRAWLELRGGSGLIPSGVSPRPEPGKACTPVYLLGSEQLSQTLWKALPRGAGSRQG